VRAGRAPDRDARNSADVPLQLHERIIR